MEKSLQSDRKRRYRQIRENSLLKVCKYSTLEWSLPFKRRDNKGMLKVWYTWTFRSRIKNWLGWFWEDEKR
jgi:hypothetical protein